MRLNVTFLCAILAGGVPPAAKGQAVPARKSDSAKSEMDKVRTVVIQRCRSQMGEYGSSLVKVCVDEDMAAWQRLSRAPAAHRKFIARCESQMAEYGWSLVETCAKEDIKAEKALNNY